VRAGSEILVKTERPAVTLSLSEMDQGSWVIFELPGFTQAASGTEQGSLDALRQANETSYFRDGDDPLGQTGSDRASGHADPPLGHPSQHSSQQIGTAGNLRRAPVRPGAAEDPQRPNPAARLS
jgi:cell migration-inducing and hyaluronan-binding protein